VKSSHKAAKSYTSKISHTQTLGEIFARSAWKGVGREERKFGRCSNGGVVGTHEWKEKGYKYHLP
jgi:hypothetical protein